MSHIEKRARELLAVVYSDAGWHGLANEIRMNATFDIDHGLALAAIRAALTPPEGYVLVPVEPTEAMKDAFQGFRPVQRTNFACRYEEMLAARPEVP